MVKRIKLFGGNIPPACSYCQFGRPSSDKVMVLCRKYGPVSPYYKCRRFFYDPIKRVPRRTPALPEFSADDFSLD